IPAVAPKRSRRASGSTTYKATLASPLTWLRVSSATGLSTTPIGAPLTASSSACFCAASRRSVCGIASCIRFTASMLSPVSTCWESGPGGPLLFGKDIGVGLSIAIRLTRERAGNGALISRIRAKELLYTFNTFHFRCMVPGALTVGGVGRALARAAEVMGLHDRVPYLRERFRATPIGGH